MSEDPSVVIDQGVRRKARIVRGILFTAALWLILYGAICLEQAVSWSDPIQGLMNGAMLGWLFAAFSLVVMFFELHTDQSKTRVHIVMGDI